MGMCSWRSCFSEFDGRSEESATFSSDIENSSGNCTTRDFRWIVERLAVLPLHSSLGLWILVPVVWALAVNWAVPVEAQTTDLSALDAPIDLTVTPGNDMGDNTTTMLTAMWMPPAGSRMYQVAWRPVGDSDWTNEVATIDTTYTIDELAPGTDYLVAVRAASGSAGLMWGSWSDLVQATTAAGTGSPGLSAPGVPTGLTLGAGDGDGSNTETMLTASWKAPSGIDDGTYEVAWRHVDDSDWVHEPSTMDTVYTISGLTANAIYWVAVRASHSGDGTAWGDWSALVQGTTAIGTPDHPTPDMPTELVLTPGDENGGHTDTMLTAMWQAPADIVGGSYQVAWRHVDDSDWVHGSNTTKTVYTIGGLTPNADYAVAVRASHGIDGAAWGPWSDSVQGTTATGTPAAPTPDVPKDLVLMSGDDEGYNTDTMLTAMWQAPADIVGGSYQVAWRSRADSGWVYEASTIETVYTISGLTPNADYAVAVRASHSIDGAAWGSWSGTVDGSTSAGTGSPDPGLAKPDAPAGLVLMPGEGDGADMMLTAMWQAPADIVGGSYEVAWRPASARTWVHESVTEETTYTITGLMSGTGYWVAVRASYSGGTLSWGPWSDLVMKSTSGGTAAGDPSTPGAPTGLELEPGDDGITIDATWVGPVDGDISESYDLTYEVAWRPVNRSYWVHEAIISETAYTIDGLTPDRDYLVAVRASYRGDGTGWGPWSDLVQKGTAAGTPTSGLPPPGAPTGLEVDPGDDGTTIDMIWVDPVDVGGAGSYELAYQVAWRPIGRSDWTHESNTAYPNYIISGLTPGTGYWVAVRAANTGDNTGWGPWSKLVRTSTVTAVAAS